MNIADSYSSSKNGRLNVYEAKSLKSVSESRMKQFQQLKGQMESLKAEFAAMSELADFHGKGADAIKGFYKQHAEIAQIWIHLLEARIAFLVGMEGYMEDYDLASETVVEVPFLQQDVVIENRKSMEMVDQQHNDLTSILAGIRDIISLEPFSKSTFENHMEDAEKERRETDTKTHELDEQLVNEYTASSIELTNIQNLLIALMNATTQGADISPMNYNATDFLNSEAYRNREAISNQSKEYVGFKKKQEEAREIAKEIEAQKNRPWHEKAWDVAVAFTGEVSGYYDYKRSTEGIDPLTGQQLTAAERIAAGGMAAAGFIPVVGWIGRGAKGGKALYSTAKGIDAADDALDAYKTVESLEWVDKSGKGINGLIKANEMKLGRNVGKGIDNANHPIRTYRNVDLKKLEEKYTADPRITIEMPYVGKGKPGTNAEGWLRDKDFYWKEIMNKHPESVSKQNKHKIELGFSPINDKKFREHFPQYDIKELYNDKLIHHHVGGGGQAVAVPSKLHPGTGGIHNAEKAAGVWGNDSEYAELLEKFINK